MKADFLNYNLISVICTCWLKHLLRSVVPLKAGIYHFNFEQLGSLFDSGNLCSSFTTHIESLIVGTKYVGDLNLVITEMQS